jgi:methylamine dehydrogenase light chain
MKSIDRYSELWARHVARRTSRRGFFGRVGVAVIGVAAVPLLPVARTNASGSKAPGPDEKALEGAVADPTSCEYWRHCAIDGFLCACCGGSETSCPPGTVASPVTWIGTCRNPGDGKDYIISYNDCCGKSGCGRCYCNRNEGDKPVYIPALSNDINWCAGSTGDIAYHCSLAVVLGVATEEE